MATMRSVELRRQIALGLYGLCVFCASATRGAISKPMLHGTHWIAITGKPLAATAGATIFDRGCNAVDAALSEGGDVRVSWGRADDDLEIVIEVEGPGLGDTANLFVPFFTTKPGGSGIGLVLSRQIAEGHGGTIEVQNRPGGQGVLARLILPLDLPS